MILRQHPDSTPPAASLAGVLSSHGAGLQPVYADIGLTHIPTFGPLLALEISSCNEAMLSHTHGRLRPIDP